MDSSAQDKNKKQQQQQQRALAELPVFKAVIQLTAFEKVGHATPEKLPTFSLLHEEGFLGYDFVV